MLRRFHKNVGVIGLGIIGRRVAATLRKHGFSVFVWNRTPRPVPNFVGSPAEVAQLCDFIQIFVSDDEALLGVVKQLDGALAANHVVTAHCTVAPATMRAAAEIVGQRGGRFLDAPFTGSKLAAEKGELVYYVGGEERALNEIRPVLEASSKEIMLVGDIGQATVVKVATNLITAATVQAGAEALAITLGAGLSAEKLLGAMQSNATNSVTLGMKLPKMVEADYDPHFSIKHMLKDVRIAREMAQSFSIELPVTGAAASVLADEVEQGHGDDDYSAVSRRFVPAPKVPASESGKLTELIEATEPRVETTGASAPPSNGTAPVDAVPDALRKHSPVDTNGAVEPTSAKPLDETAKPESSPDQSDRDEGRSQGDEQSESERRRGLLSRLFTADY